MEDLTAPTEGNQKKEKIGKNKGNGTWQKFALEFLSIFVGVVAAFALTNWAENKRDYNSGHKILTEISNGIGKDLADIETNVAGHKTGISACNYFKQLIIGKDVSGDSLMFHYFNLTRDFISIQNTAGYETLKSKGLELITNDSLRLKIISLYEYDYSTMRKLEEEYAEMQFQESYFKEINNVLSPHFIFDESGNYNGVNLPFQIPESDKKKLLVYLWKIQLNRIFTLQYYTVLKSKIVEIKENIGSEIKR